MRLLKKMLKQKCVYWEPMGKNEYSEDVFGEMAELKCRWEEGTDEVLTVEGKEINPTHLVYVESDVKIGGLLMLIAIDDLEGTEPPEEAKRIIQFNKLPTMDAKHWLRTAYL